MTPTRPFPSPPARRRRPPGPIPVPNYFYGATTEKPTLDSAYVRGLTKSNKAYAAGTVTITCPPGRSVWPIACLASKAGGTKVINETAMNADVTSTFVQSTRYRSRAPTATPPRSTRSGCSSPLSRMRTPRP